MMLVDESVRYAHVADYAGDFAEQFSKTLSNFLGYETEVYYSTSAQPDGQVLFSALIIGKLVNQPLEGAAS
ncbi:hypothetical protein ACTP13_19415 [Paenibacillus peoriae]|uniref:hypothetical protein n=1 Tax=Paenibacillus peoriae TaxID=59893 RepID=UPI003F9971C0